LFGEKAILGRGKIAFSPARLIDGSALLPSTSFLLE
jgi:hypothetical protein